MNSDKPEEKYLYQMLHDKFQEGSTLESNLKLIKNLLQYSTEN